MQKYRIYACFCIPAGVVSTVVLRFMCQQLIFQDGLSLHTVALCLPSTLPMLCWLPAGYFKLASLVQYVPLPTVGGYLGASPPICSTGMCMQCTLHICTVFCHYACTITGLGRRMSSCFTDGGEGQLAMCHAGYVGYFCLAAGINLACNVEVRQQPIALTIH